MKRIVITLALTVLATVGIACDPADVYRLPVAAAGKRCGLEGQWARNGSHVLQCSGRRWRVSMSIASAVDQINAYNARANRGTPEAPLPMAAPADMGNGWSVRLTGALLDGPAVWDILYRENQFNDPPAEGYQYLLVGLGATNTGPGSGSFLASHSLPTIFTSDGVELKRAFGVLPNEFDYTGEVLPGGTRTGDELFLVPVGATNIRIKVSADNGAVAWFEVR